MNETKNPKFGYWWECTRCDYWQKEPGIVKSIRSLSRSNWDQKLLVQPCPSTECNSSLRIAFYKNLKNKRIVLLYHLVGISWDDEIKETHESSVGPLLTVTDFLPMMWEWKPKYPEKNSQEKISYFDFKHINIERPNVNTLTNIVSLTERELERLLELHRERTGNEDFLKTI